MSYLHYTYGFNDGYREGYRDRLLGLPPRVPLIEPLPIPKFEPLPKLEPLQFNVNPPMPQFTFCGEPGCPGHTDHMRCLPKPGPGARLGPPGGLTW